MNKKIRYTIYALLAIAFLGVVTWFIYSTEIAVLTPKGTIAEKQRNLIVTATWMMLIVVIPVFVLTFFISWKYRAGSGKGKYMPDWDRSHLIETIWWGVPFVIITILGVITWNSCHELDPFKPLKSDKKPLTIRVVALQWKWLFIYPEQKIATVNFFQIPERTPINFEITSDAPMNAFWIPQLGGQIYAMPGMTSKLHLIANEVGNYRGSSANLSGRGFSGMVFTAKASSEADFDEWVKSVRGSPLQLTSESYVSLAKPSEYDPIALYALGNENLFEQIVMKYMMPMDYR